MGKPERIGSHWLWVVLRPKGGLEDLLKVGLRAPLAEGMTEGPESTVQT